ncbi:hypothetical protein MC7420_6753 [Coleofasciculus chthonoplastes PCC 7420]|uniref:Uncharacterized protein n=1 Tax=Coleofasciculus chthonoplastes PCC 7420 TaxID=118168 RepID=B4VWH3_9CYAN|nr:hypothetical protein MC7420_6753 [Coleofasciculus chthonoplastes PCC 7420]
MPPEKGESFWLSATVLATVAVKYTSGVSGEAISLAAIITDFSTH